MTLDFGDRVSWRAWLAKNHASSGGVWLSLRKGKGDQRAAVEEALCFGWIDSQVRALDGRRFLQRFTPRRPGSTWSAINKERVARLIRQRWMTAAGRRAIAAAKRDGSWDRLTALDAMKMPADLAAALKANPRAAASFGQMPPSTRKQYVWLVASAKREETRRRRVAIALRMLEQGRRFDVSTRLRDFEG